jgi:hypothetical protein
MSAYFYMIKDYFNLKNRVVMKINYFNIIKNLTLVNYITSLRSVIIILVLCLAFVLKGIAQKDLTLEIGSGMGVPGTVVCVDVKTFNFSNIESFQFSITYDATVVIPECPVKYIHPNLIINSFGSIFNCMPKEKGFLPIVFASEPTTIPDGETLFTICFKLVGRPGDNTNISISNYPFDPEICGLDNQGNTDCNINLICKCGGIMIKDLERPGKHGITNTKRIESELIEPSLDIRYKPFEQTFDIEPKNEELSDGLLVQIFNTFGFEVTQHKMFGTYETISINGLRNGVYYIVVSRQGSIIQTKKLLKM